LGYIIFISIAHPRQYHNADSGRFVAEADEPNLPGQISMKKTLFLLLVWLLQTNPAAAQGPGDYQSNVVNLSAALGVFTKRTRTR